MGEREDCEKDLLNKGKEFGEYIEGISEVLGYWQSVPAAIKAILDALPISERSKRDILRENLNQYSSKLMHKQKRGEED